MIDVIKELTWLRDTVRQSVERATDPDLKPGSEKELAKRKRLLKQIEASLRKLQG
jgi:hypothetical protein